MSYFHSNWALAIKTDIKVQDSKTMNLIGPIPLDVSNPIFMFKKPNNTDNNTTPNK